MFQSRALEEENHVFGLRKSVYSHKNSIGGGGGVSEYRYPSINEGNLFHYNCSYGENS
jgi:hypothetical protein